MKTTLKLLSFSVLSALIAIGGGCSSGDGDKQPNKPGATLTLSSNKTSILADGEDAAQLTVFYSGSQEDVTSKAELSVNGQPLSTSEFTTETPGSYTVKATYEGVTSNTLTITAVSGDTAEGITLKASKESIYADGGDFSLLTLQTADGSDVTAQGTFYANGEPLEGNQFRSTTGSLTPVQITAKFNGLDVEGSIAVTATKNYTFTSRLLLEDITKTNCPNCPKVINLIEELRKDAQQIVVPYSIHNSDCYIYKQYYSPATRKFADEFCTFVNENLTVAPKVYVNRLKQFANMDIYTADKLREEARNGSKEVALAVESTIEDGTKIAVKATVGSKKDFTGKIVVVLVENGIQAEQETMGKIEMYRTMRAYAPSVEGESRSFRTGVATTYSATFDLNDTRVVNAQQCEVIAFVTDDADGLCENVQFAAVGEQKGY